MNGTWYVVRTSLPFWRTRTDPAISYTPLPDGRVTDTVTYRRAGRDQVVIGVDSRTTDDSGDGWIWRGLGAVTRWTSSRWRMLATEADWALSSFARTPFTPAGIDLLWRSPHPDEDRVAEVLARLPSIAEAAPYAARLFAPVHRRSSLPS
ncbi:histidinol-phosphatase (PHP family) [Microlunatus soli]|uniref:Histidinol-phosphatase (PHP family) n=2 Tax=Microlunatus soli TaxID=630515 RepID=A0A1H1WJA8_9ACTN|nr:histidinol-phosphatase (PHP family) [Microlunatus soli]